MDMVKLGTKGDMDLKKIADSGQCFRWEELAAGEGEISRFRIPVRESCLIIAWDADGSVTMDCSEAEFNELWRDYLDLGTSYRAVREAVDKDEDPFLYRAASHCKGIRILKQDPWETLISFIISQNRNIPAIKRSVEMLCSLAGKTYRDKEGREFYSFPSAEDILSMDDDALMACRLGYRDVYIKTAARDMAEGRIDFTYLMSLDADEAIEELKKLKGVGPKVASCVALFGLHKLDAFPIDVWMKKVLANEYSGGYPMEKYSPYNGIYQQYMFAYYREMTKALS